MKSQSIPTSPRQIPRPQVLGICLSEARRAHGAEFHPNGEFRHAIFELRTRLEPKDRLAGAAIYVVKEVAVHAVVELAPLCVVDVAGVQPVPFCL